MTRTCGTCVLFKRERGEPFFINITLTHTKCHFIYTILFSFSALFSPLFLSSLSLSLFLGANLPRRDKSVFVPLIRHINLASRQILKMRSSPFHLLLATFVGLTNFYERLRNSTSSLFLLLEIPYKKLNRFYSTQMSLREIIIS